MTALASTFETDTDPDNKRPRLLRHVLDRDLVVALAGKVQAAAWQRGWIDREGRAAPHMRAKRLETGNPGYVSFLAEVLTLEEVVALRSDATLTDALRRVSGEKLTPLAADICRITFPGETHGTPAHQDAWYCRAPGLWIAWLPLVTCTRRLGPLQVAGRETELLAHDETGLTEDVPLSWQTVPCAPGDVLLFSGLTPHRSLPNRSAGRPRLSIDLRFGLDPG